MKKSKQVLFELESQKGLFGGGFFNLVTVYKYTLLFIGWGRDAFQRAFLIEIHTSSAQFHQEQSAGWADTFILGPVKCNMLSKFVDRNSVIVTFFLFISIRGTKIEEDPFLAGNIFKHFFWRGCCCQWLDMPPSRPYDFASWSWMRGRWENAEGANALIPCPLLKLVSD